MLEQLGLIGTIRDEDPIPDEAETESEQEVSRIRDQSPSAGIGVSNFRRGSAARCHFLRTVPKNKHYLTLKSMELVTVHRNIGPWDLVLDRYHRASHSSGAPRKLRRAECSNGH